MAIFPRTTKELIQKIDEFFENIEVGVITFNDAIKAYLFNKTSEYQRYTTRITELEEECDKLQNYIENEMIKHSILPQHREEVCNLIDTIDDLIDSMKRSLMEIGVELPYIPESINNDFMSLTEVSTNAISALVPAARAYFRTPGLVRELLLKVYYYESEADKIAINNQKIIFQDLDELDLAHKSHLRYIMNHIEKLSDLAQKGADLLSIMAVRIEL